MKYTSRPLYESKLEQALWNSLVKVITGQRRVGKSMLLKHMLHEWASQWYLLDLELRTHRDLLDPDALYAFLTEQVVAWATRVWVDEIQKCVWREEVIISLIKEYPQVDFFVTWSNSALLSSDLTTLLRGRYIQVHVYPFGIQEYADLKQVEMSRAAYMNYLDEWSFPMLYTLETIEQKRERSQYLIHTIFFRDVIERYQIRNAQLLEELFLFVVDSVSAEVSMDSIRKVLKQRGIHTSVNTLQEYMWYLIEAYLVYPVDLYDIQWKRLFDRNRKYYPSDHIWRKVLLWDFDLALGKICETNVYFEMKRKWREVKVGKIKGKEVDFIATKGWQKIYVQVAYLLESEKTVEREFGVFDLIKDHHQKYVVSVDEIVMGHRDGVQHMPIWMFVEKVL